MWNQIGEATVPKEVFGFGDCVLADIDAEKKVVRVSVFNDGHFKDELFMKIEEDDELGGLCTDADKWKKKCLELAAQCNTEVE